MPEGEEKKGKCKIYADSCIRNSFGLKTAVDDLLRDATHFVGDAEKYYEDLKNLDDWLKAVEEMCCCKNERAHNEIENITLWIEANAGWFHRGLAVKLMDLSYILERDLVCEIPDA
jgi:hypothetical protein